MPYDNKVIEAVCNLVVNHVQAQFYNSQYHSCIFSFLFSPV